jgi:hypothetical protein
MFILVFYLHKATCGLKIKVIHDLTSWDEGPHHLPTNRKPSAIGTGFQQNSEKRWLYQIIFWAVQSHQNCMEIISVWFFSFFSSKIFKQFLNSVQASSLIHTWCNCKELRAQGQIGGMQWKVRTILHFSSGSISTASLHKSHIWPYFLGYFCNIINKSEMLHVIKEHHKQIILLR